MPLTKHKAVHNKVLPRFVVCPVQGRNLQFSCCDKVQREVTKPTNKRKKHMNTCCIDPPEKRNPGLRPGFQTEPSLNNSAWVPERNFNEILLGGTPKVKAHPQLVVDKKRRNTTCSGKKIVGISHKQQKRLNRFDSQNHPYALLLALNGDLTPEHCERKVVCDNWEAEILRRAGKFS
jgi:hypothetical protein